MDVGEIGLSLNTRKLTGFSVGGKREVQKTG
jgi:hypothetical protein